jgi:hypothetical protein
MTIINVSVTPQRALVAVDTEAVDLERKVVYEVAKLFAIPHRNAVITGRGSSELILHAVRRCSLLDGDFDLLAEAMPAILKEHTDIDSRVKGRQEFFFVGWSPERGSMRVHSFVQEHSTLGFLRQHDAVDMLLYGPWSEEQGKPPEIETIEGMREAMSLQVRHQRERYPGGGHGGRMIVAEMTERAMSIADAGPIG